MAGPGQRKTPASLALLGLLPAASFSIFKGWSLQMSKNLEGNRTWPTCLRLSLWPWASSQSLISSPVNQVKWALSQPLCLKDVSGGSSGWVACCFAEHVWVQSPRTVPPAWLPPAAPCS